MTFIRVVPVKAYSMEEVCMSQDPKNRFSLEDGGDFSAPNEKKEEAKNASGEDSNDYASEEVFEQDKGNLIDFLQFPKEKEKND